MGNFKRLDQVTVVIRTFSAQNNIAPQCLLREDNSINCNYERVITTAVGAGRVVTV